MSELNPKTPTQFEKVAADLEWSDLSPAAKDAKTPTEFERAAADSQGESLAGEFWAFLAQNKKWWLLPIVIVMLLLGVLFVLSSTAAAPFIYTLF
jgi:Family of unknown function (DUF5989)